MTEASTAPPALDPQGLARLAELDPQGQGDLVGRVLVTYARSLERMQMQLQAAQAGQDLNAAMQLAHTLKSSSAAVGALELARRCANVELRIREQRLDGITEGLDDLQAEIQRVADAVRARGRGD